MSKMDTRIGDLPLSEKTDATTDTPTPEWVRPSKHDVSPNLANATMALDELAQLKGMFRRNLLTDEVEMVHKLPNSPGLFAPHRVTETDTQRITIYLQTNRMPSIGPSTVSQAIDVVADANGYDPLADYLRSLSWDRKPRLDRWLEEYAGVKPKDGQETMYVRAVAAKTLLAAVARGLSPGCQVDSVLILCGRQGAGKSTLVRALASPQWFGDALPPLNGKDASIYLLGKWFVELSELASLKRSEVEATKAFLSRKIEEFRPPYGTKTKQFPRRCIFVGTSNNLQFLTDATGNRRFWPVTVGEIDIQRVMDNRDQLFAEAVHRFDQGETWHLPPDLEARAEQIRRGFQQEDPWEPAIGEFLARTPGPVHVADVLERAINMERSRCSRTHFDRVRDILLKRGYVPGRKTNRGIPYVPPT